MSHTLKDAATSTLNTVSHLVDDAQGHLEHLPMLHRRTAWWQSKWAIAGAAVVLLAAMWTIVGRRGRDSAERVTGAYSPDSDHRSSNGTREYDTARS